MTDRISKEQRSYNMSRIRSSGTKPEQRLIVLLTELFPTEQILMHPKDIPGKPDAWIPNLKLAIFADGCFFHGCPKHGHIPHENQEYWKAKIKRNRKRDREINKLLKEMGIISVRLWEHQLGKDLKESKAKIKRSLRKYNTQDFPATE